MDSTHIEYILKNAGLTNVTVDGNFITFQDPSCILPVFDNVLNIGWFVISLCTLFMLFGWGVLYIRNGVKMNSVFNNFKALFLIFLTLSVVKPVVNIIYGKDLFAKGCDTHQVSLQSVQELIQQRNQRPGMIDVDTQYEIFDVFDSMYSDKPTVLPGTNINIQNVFKIAAQMVGPGVLAFDENTTIFKDKNGNIVERKGGRAAWRNNNPGNIISTGAIQSNGAIGKTNKWAVFPDERTGLMAIAKLFRTPKYINKDLLGAMSTYAPVTDNNNPVKYTNFISKNTGIAPSTPVRNMTDADLFKIARAIQKYEGGWIPGQEIIHYAGE